ncbi:enoyl-CoA hydratase-related protein [Jeongeupia naejangsanensis]|uniref:Enoyl-CoA hydratase/isomerase family protein n=1 Tax=Jeongeupia naejangsanensis TaxID=613195 RepID=A0ABS2BIL6_9NEIS|nr:enoyl-CoA hydratase-related protein [Jeongeupia naejangsanensis]MBM3115310.1 enoyl-CoA hydratase/isomerase family protein [Jeongeupia naejangsanensis]
MSDTLSYELADNGVATVTLHEDGTQTVNEILIAELTACLTALSHNSRLRAIVLRARGSDFCTGQDARWQARMLEHDQDHHFDEALELARLLQLIDRMPVPTIARVHGQTVGVGIGLIACCDLIVAHSGSRFAIPEVRAGLVPAMIGPYLITQIGVSAARRYLLTGETFDADTARQIGLVHEIGSQDAELDQWIAGWISAVLQNGPHALLTAKRLIASVAHRPIDDAMNSDLAHRLAHLHRHPEAKEGIHAQLESRLPRWHS